MRVSAHYGQLAGLSRAELADTNDGEDGFDGQFFFFLARDPLLGSATQRALDAPRLRARRIALPLIGAALGAGVMGPATGLLAAEVLAGLALIGVVQLAAWREGISPAWCLAVPMCLPFALSLELVTAEHPTAFLLLAAAESLSRGKKGIAVLLLAVACLAKEAALAAPLVYAGWELLRGRARSAALWLSAFLPFVTWEINLLVRIPRADAVAPLVSNLALPGEGVFRALSQQTAALSADPTDFKALGLLFATGWYFVGAVGALILCSRRRTPARLLAVVGALLVLLLSFDGKPQAFNEVFNFGRQLFLLPVAAIIAFFPEGGSNSRWEEWGLGAWLAAGSVLGIAWTLQEIVL